MPSSRPPLSLQDAPHLFKAFAVPYTLFDILMHVKQTQPVSAETYQGHDRPERAVIGLRTMTGSGRLAAMTA